MFKLNCHIWCAWTYTTRAFELPIVVKIKYDLNKNSSMFKVNCRVWCAWTYTIRSLELHVVIKIKFDLNKSSTSSDP
jgi:hypothetical protein